MNYHYHIVDEKKVYTGFFQITRYTVNIEYYTGEFSGPVVRECLGKSGYVVAALCIDSQKQEFVLIEQFRIGAMAAGVHPWQTEIVAGFVDKEGESPEEAMQRELEEEIGTRADKLTKVAQYFPNPGGSGGRTILYFAEVDADKTKTLTGLHDEGEDIRVIRQPISATIADYYAGKIENATMLLAIQAYLIHLN